MNPYEAQSELLKALAHPTRLAILDTSDAGRQPMRNAAGNAPASPPPRLLIVDDDAGQRSLLDSFLRSQGFETVVVDSGDPAKGFNDPATGKAIAQQFIAQGADVLFQVAGLTGQGVLEAACDANVYGIGVDVDQVETLPNLSKCIVTSAEKKLKDTVQAVTTSSGGSDFKAGTVVYNAASNPPAIGLSPYHDLASLITPEIQAKIDEAFNQMKSGELNPPRQ